MVQTVFCFQRFEVLILRWWRILHCDTQRYSHTRLECEGDSRRQRWALGLHRLSRKMLAAPPSRLVFRALAP